MKPSDLVKVKALEWEPDDFGTLGIQYCAKAFNYLYYAWTNESEHTAEVWIGEGGDYDRIIQQSHPTEAAAKAACQAHYESMIYELLEVR